MMLDRRSLLKSGSALLALSATPALAQNDQPLASLFDTFVAENLDASPLTVSSLGMDTGARAWQKSLLDDFSPAAIARNKAVTADQLRLLSAVNRAGLKGDDLVSFDVVMYGLKTQVEGARFDYGPGIAGQPYILSQLTGSYSQVPSFLDNQHTIVTREDADAYLARLDGFGRLMDQEVEVQRHDAAEGVFAPDFALAKTLLQMKQLREPRPDASPLTESIVRRTKEKNIAGAWGKWAARIVAEKF